MSSLLIFYSEHQRILSNQNFLETVFLNFIAIRFLREQDCYENGKCTVAFFEAELSLSNGIMDEEGLDQRSR